jgi:ubiquitin-protein ligase
MVKDLAELVEGLDRITQAFFSHAHAEKLAAEEVSGLDDLRLLEEIQEATGDVATIISSAASIRHRTLEGRTIRTMSTLGSFHTAPTHAGRHTGESLADTRYIDSLIDSGRDMSPGTIEKTNPSTGLPIVAAQAESVSRNSSESQMTMDRIISANKAALQEALQTLPMSPSRVEIAAAAGSLQLSKRLVKELSRQRLENSKYFTFAPLDSLRGLLATIKGPDGTPYENGIFHIRMSIPEDYPLVPPRCWYLTKVYHPNIDNKGAICLDKLQSGYSPALSLTAIIITICALLDGPNPYDPVMPEIARQMIDDKPLFEKTAREWTRLYATGEIIHLGTREDGFCNTFS